ncbi:MAG: extracellular solute-binding protein, partial [Acidimicrobiales bacterium]
MSPRPRRLFAAGLAAVLMGALAACANDSSELMIYSGRQKDLIEPLFRRFAEDTGIDIAVRYGDSPDLALQIDTEGDRSPADVFVSQSPGAVDFLDQQGRLIPLSDDVLRKVPEEDRAADGVWVGLSGRVRVLVYNNETVDQTELPDSVFDLTDPRYGGRLGVAPGNASFQDFVTVMRAERGDDAALAWLEGLAANDAETYPNNIAIVEAVGRGEIDFGLVNHYYNERALAEDPGLPSENHFFPEGDLGGLLLVTAASVLDTNDQGDDAERLVDFLLSEEAQRFL